MAAKKSGKKFTPPQHAFVKNLAKGASQKDAFIAAGYKAKHPDQGAHQALNVAALGIRHTAPDTAFKLRGSYAPRDPAEAAQFGVKVIVLDMPRPPKHEQNKVIDVSGNGHKPPEEE